MVIKSKKGLGHIEFIFSVLLFLSFLGIALFFFAPRGTTSLVEDTLDYSFNSVLRESLVDIEIYGVKLIGDTSIRIDGLDENVRVEDVNGNVLTSGRVGDVVYVNPNGKEFINILISEDFIDGGFVSTTSPEEENYEISSSISGKILSEKNISRLKKKYEEDYDSLKREEFELPTIINFGFKLNLKDKEIEADREEQKEEVFSKSKRLEILKENGEREFGTLVVRVW